MRAAGRETPSLVLVAIIVIGACSGSSPPGGEKAPMPDGSTAPESDASESAHDGVGGASTRAADDVGSGADVSEADGGAGDAPAVALAAIHFLGRFDTRDAAGPRFAWPGTAIAATFQGTGVDVTLSDSGMNYLVVAIDGGSPTALATSGTSKTYTLAQNLAAGQHTVVLTKRTEANVGVEQLLALTPQGGALVPSPDPFSRRIEYVGDSISCGYGDLGDGPGCPFSAATEDETVAYGAVAAAALDAEQSVIAYSGKGMYRDYSGSTTDQMPALFDLALPDDATSAWGFTTPPPDVVVINLSTNDFATGDPGSPFVDAYSAFVHQLREHYPSAYIVCTASPMLDDPNRSTAAGYIQGIVQQVRAAGDMRVSTLEIPGDGGSFFGFAPQLASDGYGCDYHPTVKTHALMGTELAAALPAIIGW
jgi:lysophospholipase L1-like esterase